MHQDIIRAIAEIQQPRSNFQIEQFVVGSHNSDEMRYYQCLLEINDTMYKYRMALINIRKQELKVVKLRSTDDELKNLQADEIELGIEQTKLACIGAERELETLIKLWDSFPIKYNRQEIESAQKNYWQNRLAEQVELQLMGRGSVDSAQLEALKQSGGLEDFMTQIKAESGELANVRNLET